MGSEDALTYLGMSWDSSLVGAVADRPSGYGFFIELVSILEPSVALIIGFQHFLGLVLVSAYALCIRLGFSRIVAVAAAAILAFDSYLLTMEHWVLTETVATTLAFVAVAVTASTQRPLGIAASGLLLGTAVQCASEWCSPSPPTRLRWPDDGPTRTRSWRWRFAARPMRATMATRSVRVQALVEGAPIGSNGSGAEFEAPAMSPERVR